MTGALQSLAAMRIKTTAGFMPTGQTLCFLVTVSTSPACEMNEMMQGLLEKDCILIKEQVVKSRGNGRLSAQVEWRYLA